MSERRAHRTHEVFGDANRKSHLQPQRLSPAEEARLMAIAGEGREIEEEESTLTMREHNV